MATRIHLILALKEDQETLVSSLAELKVSAPALTGPWCWTSTSAWLVSQQDLLDLLLPTDCPFLLFSTFDGDGWDLWSREITGSLQEAHHEFTSDWRGGKKGAAQRVERLVELIGAVAQSADPKVLAEVLSGRALDGVEEESDLGDLPRLLREIGADGIIEIPQPPPPMKVKAPRSTRALSLLKGHEGRPRATLAGVKVKVEHAADLAALSLYCDPDGLLAFIAEGQDLPELEIDLPCKVVLHNGALVVEAEGGIGLKFNVIDRAARQLMGCSGLEALTVVSGRQRGGKDIAWHRYSGEVKGGTWRLQEATPPVESSVLAAAIALVGERRSEGAIKCQSESEAKAVIANCAKSLYFSPENAPKGVESSLSVTKDNRFYVLMELFRFRFAQAWETSSARRAEAAEKREWDRLERTLEQLIGKPDPK